jgi:hypothetical protein
MILIKFIDNYLKKSTTIRLLRLFENVIKCTLENGCRSIFPNKSKWFEKKNK